MLFEEFDKKLRNAADHHHPNYDEKAWEKMEKLLDKHMPVDKDRRRIFFLIFLLFIGLGGAGLFIMKPWKSGDSVAEVKPPKKETVALSSPVVVSSEPGIEAAMKPIEQTIAKSEKSIQSKSIPYTSATENKNSEPILTDKKLYAEDPFLLKPVKQEEPAKTGIVDLVKTSTSSEPTPPEPVAQSNIEKKAKSKKQHEFFISVSGGPDLSFVEGDMGRVKLFAGAGIGYKFNNRLSIRTGFYSGRKIYSADPNAYNPPANFYIYYPFLEKVDANCKVYEVPIQVSYHFGKSPDHNFYASAGVSSYFMKEEEYSYYYKYTQNGPTQNRTYTIKNANNHTFAGLTLSAGYNKSISRHVSLSAEPYVKLPLKGIGYGKVNLNSAGVSMSMKVNPFAKKPK